MEIGGEPFPSEDWLDLVLPITQWWCEGMTSIALGSDMQFDFMNGPYRVVARPQDGVVTLEGYSDSQLLCAGTVDLMALRRSLHDTILGFERACWKQDLHETVSVLKGLRQYVTDSS